MPFLGEQKVDRLKAICLQYATATQWLIPTLFTRNKKDNLELSQSAGGGERKNFKGRLSLLNKLDPQYAREAADDSNFKATIGYAETIHNTYFGRNTHVDQFAWR